MDGYKFLFAIVVAAAVAGGALSICLCVKAGRASRDLLLFLWVASHASGWPSHVPARTHRILCTKCNGHKYGQSLSVLGYTVRVLILSDA